MIVKGSGKDPFCLDKGLRRQGRHNISWQRAKIRTGVPVAGNSGKRKAEERRPEKMRSYSQVWTCRTFFRFVITGPCRMVSA